MLPGRYVRDRAALIQAPQPPQRGARKEKGTASRGTETPSRRSAEEEKPRRAYGCSKKTAALQWNAAVSFAREILSHARLVKLYCKELGRRVALIEINVHHL